MVAFERDEAFVFESISDAAIAYGMNKKIIIDRINDGATLKDGYTTLDYYSSEEDTKAAFTEMRKDTERTCDCIRQCFPTDPLVSEAVSTDEHRRGGHRTS